MAHSDSIPGESGFQSLEQRLAQREAELAVLSSVQEGLASGLNIQAIYELVGDRLREVFTGKSLFIHTYDRQTDLLHMRYLFEGGQRLYPDPIVPGSVFKLFLEEHQSRRISTRQEYDAIDSVTIPGTQAPFSGIYTPLLKDGVAFGILGVESIEQENAFSEADLRLLQTVASSMSVALENARLFDETQHLLAAAEKSSQLQVALYKIADAASSAGDMQQFYATLHGIIAELMYAENLFIALHDEQSGLVTWPYYVDTVEVEPPAPIRLEDHRGASGWVLRHGRALADVDGSAQAAVERGEMVEMGTPGDGLAIPLTDNEDRTVGVLLVQSYKPDIQYSLQDMDVLNFVARHISTALTRARALEETRQRNAELTILNSVQQGLVSNLKMQAIYELVGDKVRDIFDAQSVLIGIFDPATRTRSVAYNWEAGKRIPPSTLPFNKLTEIMMSRREPVVIDQFTWEVAEQYGLVITPGTTDAMRSGVFVPLAAGDKVFGMISLQNMDHIRAFSEADVRLLQTLANSMSVALENARLFDETQHLLKETEQRNAELAIINSVQEGLASRLEMQGIYELVGDKIREIFQADTTYIGTYHPEEQVVIAQYFVEKDIHFTYPPFPMGRGFYTQVIRSRQPVLYGTLQEQEQHGGYASPSPNSDRDLNETFLGVPILLGGEVKGIVSVQSYRQNAYDEGDVRILQTLANSMSAALENARLFAETQQRLSELATVNTVSTALAGELDLQPLIELIGEQIRGAFKADIAYVAMLDEQTNLIHFPYIHGEHLDPMQYGQGLTGRIIASGKPLLINQEQDRRRAELSAAVIGKPARSYLGVPVFAGGKAIGVVSVQNTEQENVFTQDDQRLLGTIAANVGVALQNARLFEEIRARNRMVTESLEQQTATSEVLRVMAGSPTDVQPVLDVIAERARKLCNGVFSAVYRTDGTMIDEVARSNFAPEAVEESRRWYPAPLSWETSLSSRTVLSRAVIHLPDALNHPDLPELTLHTAAALNMRSVVFVPLLWKGEAVGSIGVGKNHPEPFTEKQISLLQTFASQAVLAIENVRLFDEVTRRKEYFEALFKNNPVAVVTIDNEAVVTSWNPSAEKLFGYSRSEALGRNVDDLVAFTPHLRREAEGFSRQGLDVQSGAFQAIVKRTRKDGSLVDVELSAVPIIVQGKKQGIFALYHDITELQRARQDAIDANEAKSAFLATMSHEIRTPMNAVIGMSGLLMDTRLTREQHEFAETIRSSGDALLAIINDILDFSKIEAGRMELEHQPFDLRECVESALDLITGRVVEKNLDLAYIIEEGVPAAINGDVTRLRQVLLNLLSNAIKFTDAGEVVLTVSTAPPPASPEAPSPTESLYFSVRDTGIGLPRSQRHRLFESFSQADSSTTRRYGGTGLGLAISKRLAEMMGGSMWADSAGAGKGSTFTFSILASPAQMELRKSARQPDGLKAALEGKRLLVVDDNATNRRILMLQTEKWGMHPTATGSPREALRWMKAGETFDLAILDLQMPVMDGLTLARQLRKLKNGKKLPIILLTSLGRREEETGSVKFAATLSKPLKPSSLLDALAGIFVPGSTSAPITVPAALDRMLAERRPLRILLVEDNAVNQKLALKILEQMGYRADVASNGLEAVESVRRQTYDLVLMDVQMPEMDGLEATRRIRKARGLVQPRITAMTANAMQEDREICLAAGMDDYISKPIRINELVQVLERAVPVEASRRKRPARKPSPQSSARTRKARKEQA